jgi:hypothetical protein
MSGSAHNFSAHLHLKNNGAFSHLNSISNSVVHEPPAQEWLRDIT